MTSKQYLTSIAILHSSLMMGVALIMAIIYFFTNSNKLPLNGVEGAQHNEVYLVGLLAIGSVLASVQLFNMRLKKIKELKNLNEKLNNYRSASLIRYALLEGPALLAIVFYFVTNNPILLAFTVLILILFLMYRPTKQRIIKDLELNADEQAQLDNPDAIVADAPTK